MIGFDFALTGLSANESPAILDMFAKEKCTDEATIRMLCANVSYAIKLNNCSNHAHLSLVNVPVVNLPASCCVVYGCAVHRTS